MRNLTTFDGYPDNIAKALRRADAYWKRDKINMTFHIRSRNEESPLTDEEKRSIELYWGMQNNLYTVVFDN